MLDVHILHIHFDPNSIGIEALVLHMENQNTTAETPRKSAGNGRQSSPMRLSIKTSPAKAAFFRPSPASPSRSMAGSIMESSISALFANSVQQKPLERGDCRIWNKDLPQDHLRPSYTSAEADSAHRISQKYKASSRSFFDPDSSEIESPKSLRRRSSRIGPRDSLQAQLDTVPQNDQIRDQSWSNFQAATKDDAEPFDPISAGQCSYHKESHAAAPLPHKTTQHQEQYGGLSIGVAKHSHEALADVYRGLVDEPARNRNLHSWQAKPDGAVHENENDTADIRVCDQPKDDIAEGVGHIEMPQPDIWAGPAEQWSQSELHMQDLLAQARDEADHHMALNSPYTGDRILSAFGMALKAMLQEDTNQAKQATLDLPADFDLSFGSFQHPPKPLRPERPTSGVDSFIFNQPLDATSVHSAPVIGSKPPPAPLVPAMPEMTPTHEPRRIEETARSVSSPAATDRKKVSIATPPIRLEDSMFKPPEVYTPLPYPRTQAVQPMPLQSPALLSRRETSKDLSQSFNQPRVSREDTGAISRKQKRNPISHAVSAATVSSATTLILIVHRRREPDGRLTASIPIPQDTPKLAPPEIGASIAPGSTNDTSTDSGAENHFASLDLDDRNLFTQLRTKYYTVLLGETWTKRVWRRCFSARILKRITPVSAEEHGTSTEDDNVERDLLVLFRNPKLGAEKYAWVHWVQGLSESETAKPLRTSRSPSLMRERVLTLRFREDWSVARIVTAISFVLVVAVGVCILWVFLGPNKDVINTSTSSVDAELHAYRNGTSQGFPKTVVLAASQTEEQRAARVGTGLIMSVVVLFGGWTGVAAWMGISWLVM